MTITEGTGTGTGTGPRPDETDDSVEAAGQFARVVAAELGAAASLAMAVLGDRLGLFEAMAVAGPLMPSELAARTGSRRAKSTLFTLCPVTDG